ncbi:hypothetical protein ACQ4M3_08835 [Leptolyngbya sp. AN03gr2]|uniref:hypothetical protein n=1 Tax=unclassified Leptolyngbya TaxID=2650499 RepID=UPI003D321E46
MSKLEIAIGLITIVSSIAATLIFIWKLGNAVATMQSDLRSQIAASNYERSMNDLRLEHLQDSLTLGFNGMREKFEHFSTRSRSEYEKLESRVRRIENVLQKEFESFEP